MEPSQALPGLPSRGIKKRCLVIVACNLSSKPGPSLGGEQGASSRAPPGWARAVLLPAREGTLRAMGPALCGLGERVRRAPPLSFPGSSWVSLRSRGGGPGYIVDLISFCFLVGESCGFSPGWLLNR